MLLSPTYGLCCTFLAHFIDIDIDEGKLIWEVKLELT
jgi:hypothetical protein